MLELAVRLTMQQGAPAGAGTQPKVEAIISAPFVIVDAAGAVHFEAVQACSQVQNVVALAVHKVQELANSAAAQKFAVPGPQPSATMTLPFVPLMSAVVDIVKLP